MLQNKSNLCCNPIYPEQNPGMPDNWRYFCMGNALVVGLIEKMGKTLLT